MTGTVFYDTALYGTAQYGAKSEHSTAETDAQQHEPEAYRTPTEELHVAHELVAITNGADYCLCGNTWPCEKRAG